MPDPYLSFGHGENESIDHDKKLHFKNVKSVTKSSLFDVISMQ